MLGAESGTAAANDLQMPPEQMLDLTRRAAELLVERIEKLPGENAWEGESRQVLDDQLLEDPPEDGRPAAEVIERAAREVLPLTARNDHPRFFGFIPSSPTWPGVVADFMAAGYHINQCTWLVASGPSQLELVVIDGFRRWLGYPEGAGGLFTSGGSAASLDAFVAAREAAGHPERATAYMSDQSHSALSRAAMIVGVRRDRIRMVPSDSHFRMDREALAAAVAEDRAAGFAPIAVAANAGTTGTGAIDPLEEMADFCAAEGLWLHVDAAYGGFAIVTERGKRLLRGIARADSIGLDAHEWFCQPYEAGGLLVKDENTLKDAFAVRPDILQDTVWGANHPNFSNLGLQLSRSVRALKVWMSVQTFRAGGVPARGVEGNGAVRTGGRVHPCKRGSGGAQRRVAGDHMLPGRSGGGRPRGGGAGGGQPGRAGPHILGRPRVHVVDDAARDVRAPDVHRQLQHGLGRRARDPGGGRTLRQGGVVEGRGRRRVSAHPAAGPRTVQDGRRRP